MIGTDNLALKFIATLSVDGSIDYDGTAAPEMSRADLDTVKDIASQYMDIAPNLK